MNNITRYSVFLSLNSSSIVLEAYHSKVTPLRTLLHFHSPIEKYSQKKNDQARVDFSDFSGVVVDKIRGPAASPFPDRPRWMLFYLISGMLAADEDGTRATKRGVNGGTVRRWIGCRLRRSQSTLGVCSNLQSVPVLLKQDRLYSTSLHFVLA